MARESEFWSCSRRLGALMCIVSGAVFAQEASILGSVKDPSGAVIAHASVTVKNAATNVVRNTTTNRAGVYTLPQLQPGVYTLTAGAPHFQQQVIEGIHIDVQAKVVQDVVLQLGDVAQSVTVNGNALAVNTVDASVSTVVNRQFVGNLPLNGRSFQSLLTLVPGVTVVPSSGVGSSGEISVNGQRTEANYFTVDGVSANTGAPPSASIPGWGGGLSGSTPGETVLGTTQSMVSIGDLEEFRTTTSTYSAEYGHVPGGQFAFTTRSGTNRWHGSLFDYFRNDALDANNWFSNTTGEPKQPERQNDFGGTLGGPVTIPGGYNGKDRTFFFLSYEGLRLRTPQSGIATAVPDLAMRNATSGLLRTVLHSFPVPNGPEQGNGLALFTGGYSIPSMLNATSIRIDHTFSEEFKVFGRFSDVPSSSTSRSTADLAQLVSSRIDVKTLTLGATNLITPHLANEARFGFTWNDSSSTDALDTFGGARPFSITDLPGLTSTSQLYVGLNFGLMPYLTLTPQSNRQRQVNATDSMSYSIGQHELKWGVDYLRTSTRTALPSLYEFPLYTSADTVLANNPLIYSFRVAIPAMVPVFTNLGVFIQDEWRLTPRLNLSLGVRWEMDPAPGDADGNTQYAVTSTDIPNLQIAPKDKPLWATTYRNFAPRFGVAYQVHPSQHYATVLRAGFGLFYGSPDPDATQGYWGSGYRGIGVFSGLAFPLTAAQLQSTPEPSVSAPYYPYVDGYDPNLKLPYTLEWNAAVEQQLGDAQTVSVTYVGSGGRRLLAGREYLPFELGNPNFAPTAWLYLTTNGATSSYNALQLQYQRRLSHGLQLLASYSWAHSIDDLSTSFIGFVQKRGDSDYDIRNNFQLALTYDIPGHYRNGWLSAALSRWAVDARITARSALPVDVLSSMSTQVATGMEMYYHPDRVSGQPLYLADVNAPGGRRINYDAFSAVAGEGNLGRNALRGFNAVQADLTLHRDFRLGERTSLQFRAEAFNVFNHPIFGNVYNALSYGRSLFGLASNTENSQLGGLNSLYQVGGPRSLQLALKLSF